MRAKIVIVNGKIEVFVEGGSYEAAAPKLVKLLDELKAAGLDFSAVSPVEQHRHDTEEARHDVAVE